MPVVLPNGEVARVPVIVSASADDAKAAKDAAIERGDLDLGDSLPAQRAILRRKEGEEGGWELQDVDEPGRVVPVRRTVAREVEKLIDNEHLRLFHGVHMHVVRMGYTWQAHQAAGARARLRRTLHLLLRPAPANTRGRRRERCGTREASRMCYPLEPADQRLGGRRSPWR